MEMVNIKINNMPLSVPKGISILEAARTAGIEIPTLCYLKKINEIGACRICMVEVKGARSLVTACVYPVNEGMEIFTKQYYTVIMGNKYAKERKSHIWKRMISSSYTEPITRTWLSGSWNRRAWRQILVIQIKRWH